MAKYKKGSKVSWPWMGGLVDGKVIDIYTSPVIKVIKGKNIKRNGSKEKPAYMVQSEAGNFALKLETELKKYE